jgi:amino-acid N-acetyltransferase
MTRAQISKTHRRTLSAPVPRRKTRSVFLRSATPKDGRRLHALITANQQEGHLLPRDLSEVTLHADRFVVAVDGRGSIIACGEVAPLSHSLAEVRSLVVSGQHRGAGVGQRLVDELRDRARASGFDMLCAFTHQPGYFARMGFSIVPHTWLPEKVFADCQSCPIFRRCGQYAMLKALDQPRPSAEPPPQSLHV